MRGRYPRDSSWQC